MNDIYEYAYEITRDFSLDGKLYPAGNYLLLSYDPVGAPICSLNAIFSAEAIVHKMNWTNMDYRRRDCVSPNRNCRHLWTRKKVKVMNHEI